MARAKRTRVIGGLSSVLTVAQEQRFELTKFAVAKAWSHGAPIRNPYLTEDQRLFLKSDLRRAIRELREEVSTAKSDANLMQKERYLFDAKLLTTSF